MPHVKMNREHHLIKTNNKIFSDKISVYKWWISCITIGQGRVSSISCSRIMKMVGLLNLSLAQIYVSLCKTNNHI